MKSMLRISALLLLHFLCRMQSIHAQCSPAETCYESVCIFSKDQLESTVWNNANALPSTYPPGGFCSMVQNDLWFAFMADANVVQLTIQPSNCQNGKGLQIGVFKDCDSTVIACNPGCGTCGNEPLSVTFAADSGAYYYLLIDGLSADVCDFTFSTIGVSNNPLALPLGLIEGKVLVDVNQDCIPDVSDQPVAGVAVRFAGNKIRVIPTAIDGSFKFYYPDTSAVVVSIDNIPGNYWIPCESSFFINTDTLPDTTQVNFLLQPVASCAHMQVDLGLPPLIRPCFSFSSVVQYCNTGTAAAENAYVEVLVPQQFTLDSTSIPVTTQSGDTFRFDIGTVQPFQCEDIVLYLRTACDGDLIGQTPCIWAHVYPDTFCLSWSQAHVEVSATCIGDSIVRFKLLNTGSQPTSANLEYIIIEDEVVLYKSPYNLAPHDSMIINQPAKGSTWRLEAQQEPGYPGRSMPAAAIEGCGGFVSVGLINAFPQDDADDFIDIECKTIVGSYDPNLKAAAPSGVGPNHLIQQNVPIEYTIHFQNTGTDTAFTIRLVDVLPSTLNVSTFRPGTSSHPCTWKFIDEYTLEVLFHPILLPDSNVNEPASHGWFEYTIQQKADLPNGTYIENSAAIYFDYNDPVVTDPAWHNVGKLTVNLFEPSEGKSIWRVLGNPVQESCTFQTQALLSGPSRFELTDAQGRQVRSAEFSGQQFAFLRGHLTAGVYFFNIYTAHDGVASGKIVLKD